MLALLLPQLQPVTGAIVPLHMQAAAARRLATSTVPKPDLLQVVMQLLVPGAYCVTQATASVIFTGYPVLIVLRPQHSRHQVPVLHAIVSCRAPGCSTLLAVPVVLMPTLTALLPERVISLQVRTCSRAPVMLAALRPDLQRLMAGRQSIDFLFISAVYTGGGDFPPPFFSSQ